MHDMLVDCLVNDVVPPLSSEAGVAVSQNDSRAGRHGIIVAYETARLASIVSTQVVCPAEANRLVPEFSFNIIGALSFPGEYGVLHGIFTCLEASILSRIADYGYLLFCRSLVKAGWQQAVVF